MKKTTSLFAKFYIQYKHISATKFTSVINQVVDRRFG